MPTGRKPSGVPIRHNNPSVKFTEYPNVPYKGKVPVNADPTWPDETKEWWSFVRAMPHCAGWGPTDWRWAKDTGHVHAQWIRTLDSKYLPELRQREAKMGTLADTRLSIRVRWVDPADIEDPDATVTPIRKLG